MARNATGLAARRADHPGRLCFAAAAHGVIRAVTSLFGDAASPSDSGRQAEPGWVRGVTFKKVLRELAGRQVPLAPVWTVSTDKIVLGFEQVCAVKLT
jgi:hypothetical protein